MKERGILFNDDMVRAINSGRKTVTRRPIKVQPPASHRWRGWVADSTDSKKVGMTSWGIGDGVITDAVYARCPYGQPGDRLYVREAHCINDYRGAAVPEAERAECQIVYRADGLPDWEGEESLIRWTPSIHQPRWTSRTLLEITAIRVERVQDITNEQALAEGVKSVERVIDPEGNDYSPCELFGGLWVMVNGIESWNANPWVWAIEFKVITENPDS
jgi:hypothetical protein